MAAMEAPKEALADAAGDSISTAAPAAAAAQDPHRPQRIVASHPAPPQRNAMVTRDRFNHQSLGASLNSSVKHVRLVTFLRASSRTVPQPTLGSNSSFRSHSLPLSYDLIGFFLFAFRRCSFQILT